MTSTELLIPGTPKSSIENESLRAYFPDIKIESFSIGTTRSALDESTKVTIEAENVVMTEFEGNIKWFYNGQEFVDKVKEQQRQSRGEKDILLVVPQEWQEEKAKTRGIISAALKLIGINILKPRAGKFIAETIAARIEQNNQNIVYVCDNNFNLTEKFNASAISDITGKYLLLLHGTGSNTLSSFSGLFTTGDGKIYKDLYKAYEGRIIAFEHKTFSQSPIENVISLLNQLPDGITLDILSHSRGGLVGEILARISCQSIKGAFSEEEINLLKENEDAVGLLDQIHSLHNELGAKKVNVSLFVRVACPAAGTTLVSDRADTFLNVLFNILSNIPGEIASTIVDGLQALVTAVVNEKNNTKTLPGIECMRPESDFIKVLNFYGTKIKSELTVIAGDAEGEGFINKIKMFLVDFFYKEDNDLVVNTQSMKKGTGRIKPFLIYDEKNGSVTHFRYFNNPSSQKIILNALLRKGSEVNDLYRSSSQEKEVAEDIVFISKRSENNIRNLPVLYVLPGIMGSYLEAKKERIWLNFFRIALGHLKHLKIDSGSVEAVGINGKAYRNLVSYFSNDYYVIPFAYDWRKSIFEAAEELKKDVEKRLVNTKQPVSFIVHSMGGLVFRAFITTYKETWENLQKSGNCKVLMLGTPIAGSYDTARVLMGMGKNIKALAALDITSNKKRLLQQFFQYPGLLELLPAKGADDFSDTEIWRKINEIFSFDYKIEAKGNLAGYIKMHEDTFKNYKYDPAIVKYIAGRKEQTPNRIALDVDNKKVNFYATPKGDGSVTWDTIPTELLKDSTYYLDTEHGNLADDQTSFAGFNELLKTGKTTLLKTTPPVTRGVNESELMPDEEPVNVPDEQSLNRYILGTETTEKKISRQQVKVSITHGDLGHARFPVVAGHFKGDGIVEAEYVLDLKLGKYLSIRHATNNYPDDIGTHEIVLNKNFSPSGAIIIGLGDFGSLTESLLAQTIKQALLAYVIKNKEEEEKSGPNTVQPSVMGISYLLVGSAFGSLSIYNSIKALLTAVNDTNSYFATEDSSKYKIINNIEIIELYQQKAVQAARILYNILENTTIFSSTIFSPDIIKKVSGARNKIPDEIQNSWWHRLKVYEQEKTPGQNRATRVIKFSSITDKARSEDEILQTNINIVDKLITQAAAFSNNDPKLCQTLFEMLIPGEFKSYGSELRNMVLIVDKETARYPWEMLQNAYGINKHPIVTQSGFLRQLSTETYNKNIELSASNNVLVIGNPELEGYYPDLPNAGVEAAQVAKMFKSKGYAVKSFIDEPSFNVNLNLYTTPYKIIHIAAHGVLNDKKTGQTGVVLGKEVIITPSDFKAIRKIPEMVFINCCSLGTIDKADEERLQRKYEVAAGIGTQLIEMGVKAVIVAGWEVDDAAALTFSETLYIELLLKKSAFGDAVRIARETTYNKYPDKNTWGAYQCYGDPFYTLHSSSGTNTSREYRFFDPVEAIQELQSLISIIETATSRDDKDSINSKIKKIADAINLHPEWKNDASIIELMAELHKELGNHKKAIVYYEQLFSVENAVYSVRSMEQYCNIKAKLVAKDYSENNINKQHANPAITGTIEMLKNISPIRTSERSNLIGSAYLRLAKSNLSEESVVENLSESAFYYHEGYLTYNITYQKVYYYPFYNWLILSTIIGKLPGKMKKGKFRKAPGIPGKEILKQLIIDAEAHMIELETEKPSYWHKIAYSMQYLLELVHATSDDAIADCKQKIGVNLIEAMKTEGSANKLSAVKEHSEFIKNILEKYKSELSGLKLVESKIQTLEELIKIESV